MTKSNTPHQEPLDARSDSARYWTRKDVLMIKRAGIRFKVQGWPPMGRSIWDCMEFWITRTDMPAYAQIPYHVYYYGLPFDNAYRSGVMMELEKIQFGTCKVCGVEPAIVDGPCEINHEGVCEMCRIADEHGRTSLHYEARIEQAEVNLASVRQAYANGYRFTTLINGAAHELCPETCEVCKAGFGAKTYKERFLEVEHHTKGYPSDRSLDKVFKKHGFGYCGETEVIETEHWVESREDELVRAKELQRLFESAKAAHARSIAESAAMAKQSFTKLTKVNCGAVQGPKNF